MNVDQIARDIINQSIEEEDLSRCIQQNATADFEILRELMQHPALQEHTQISSMLGSRERAESTRSHRTEPVDKELRELSAQGRLNIQCILNGTLQLPSLQHLQAKDMRVKRMFDMELIIAAIDSYLAANPSKVEELQSTAREMLEPEFMEIVREQLEDDVLHEGAALVKEYLFQEVEKRFAKPLKAVLDKQREEGNETNGHQ